MESILKYSPLKKIVLLLFFFCLPVFGFAATTITPPINFGGGVDYSHICTDVQDNRACDAQNMLGNALGSVTKRNGSEPYISQAISSYPITSIFRASVDQGTNSYKSILITTWDRIYSSTGGTAPKWNLLKKDLTPNQHYTYAMIRNKVVLTGDALKDTVWNYDVVTDSLTDLFQAAIVGTETIKLRAKTLVATNNYLVLGNVMDVTEESLTGATTHYGSTLYYSLVLQPSSFTWNRFNNISSQDGEAITGMTISQGNIYIYKESSISQLSFPRGILNLDQYGGAITVSSLVSGFGCIAPRTLINLGMYDAFLARDGIILWDRNQATRIDLTSQYKPVTALIRTVIERIVRNNTQKNAHMFYYPKKQLILFGYEDPLAFPVGVPNSLMAYDIVTGEWWPLKNWLEDSFAAQTAKDDAGTLMFGGQDGKLYLADLQYRLDDAPRQLVIDTMDSTPTWTSSTTDYLRIAEGTASVRISLGAWNNNSSSITRQGVVSLGEWPDKSPVLTSDKLSFALYIATIAQLTSLRIDLQVGVTIQAFGTFFTSVTFSSSALVASSGTWARVEVPISSFPIPSDWSDATVQLAPFARCLTYYGIRFYSTGTGNTDLSIDDLRLVGGTNNPIKAFYLSKQFSLGNVNLKDFRQIVLTRQKDADSSFSIDVFSDFGEFANKKDVDASVPKEIFVLGYNGSNGFAKLDSRDFAVLFSTTITSPSIRDYMNAVADKDYLYAFDKATNSLFKLERDSLTIVSANVGSLGAGATNFNTVNQMCLVGDQLLITDTFNNRILKYNKNDLTLIEVIGELGIGTTNFMSPSGITADNVHVWVADDGNFAIKKFAFSTFGYVSEIKLEPNTIGEAVVQNDETYIYDAYNKIPETVYLQNVILEKRNKGDGSLVQQISLFPKNITAQSTYTLSGDFCLLGPYLYIGFTNGLSGTGTYYVQKRLKETFELVDEYSTTGMQFSIAGDGEPYIPTIKTERINLEAKDSTYIQLKYYDNGLQTRFKLFNQAFAGDVKPYEE